MIIFPTPTNAKFEINDNQFELDINNKHELGWLSKQVALNKHNGKIKDFWTVPLLHYESDENICQQPVCFWRIRNSIKLHSLLMQSKIVTSR